MSEDFVSAELNRVLVVLRRSLLQYLGESWPWTDPKHQEVHDRFLQLVGRQQTGIERLVETLVARGWIMDFGVFPTEFTDLHYVALDFLLAQTVDNQRAVVHEFELAIDACAAEDPAALALLQHLAAVERDNLDELQAMSRNAPAGGVSAG